MSRPATSSAPILSAVLLRPRPVSSIPPSFRSSSSPIAYDGAWAAVSTFFSSTAGLAEPPSVPSGMRCGKKILLTGRAAKGQFVQHDFAVIGQQRQVVRLGVGCVPLATGGTRLGSRKVLGVLFRQLLVDRPSQHLPGQMPKLFNLGERGLAWRSRRSKTVPGQLLDELSKHLFSSGASSKIAISSFLAHGSFLSKDSNLPSHTRNLIRTHQNHQPETSPCHQPTEPAPAPSNSAARKRPLTCGGRAVNYTPPVKTYSYRQFGFRA